MVAQEQITKKFFEALFHLLLLVKQYPWGMHSQQNQKNDKHMIG